MFRDVFKPGEIPWHEGSLIWPFPAPLLVHYQWFFFLIRLGGGLNFPSLDFRHLTPTAPTCKEIELSVNLTVIGPFLSISSFLRSRQYFFCFCRFFRVGVGTFGNGKFSLLFIYYLFSCRICQTVSQSFPWVKIVRFISLPKILTLTIHHDFVKFLPRFNLFADVRHNVRGSMYLNFST